MAKERREGGDERKNVLEVWRGHMWRREVHCIHMIQQDKSNETISVILNPTHSLMMRFQSVGRADA